MQHSIYLAELRRQGLFADAERERRLTIAASTSPRCSRMRTPVSRSSIVLATPWARVASLLRQTVVRRPATGTC
jgi:hypothetical protein